MKEAVLHNIPAILFGILWILFIARVIMNNI